MPEINFKNIAARGGSVENAFEELCCQLASRSRPADTRFERYRGAGGDGGVECKVIGTNGCVTGWQTKYVFDIDGLLKQTQLSFETALSIHPDLTRYVVCFPFDLTGKTGRKGKSQTEKFDEWARKVKADAKAKGHALTIERRSAHDLQDLVLANDRSGGLRHYFFSATTFSEVWFENHIATAKHIAGPRYNREISLKTPLSEWFLSFEGELDWQAQFATKIEACRKETNDVERLVEKKSADPAFPGWPETARGIGKRVVANSQACVQSAEALVGAPTEEGITKLQTCIDHVIVQFASLENDLTLELDTKHGKGSSDSKRFRSFMAEYQCSFPAANLDAVRDAQRKWRAFSDWLSSPAGYLAFKPVFVLSGTGGAGKTHSLCDIAQRRLADGAYTCVVFGHQFSGEPDPWTRFAESIGAPLTLGCDGVLDALDAAAECSGKKLVICVDAVNETRPKSYWFGRFAEFAMAVLSRAHLKLCVSCRTSFLPVCLPKDFADQAVEHKGFAGMEREACNAFFSHYELEPPLVPVLQPELVNPLYLKLVCETLKAKGLKQLPKGWFGIAPVIRAFLAYKEEQFATEHSVSSGAAIVSGSLRAISAAIARVGSAALHWSEAQSVIDKAKPQAKGLNVLQWLVTADLLIEDGPSTDAIGAENVVRPAFERFGDFLVASEMLDSLTRSNVSEAFRSGGQFAHLLGTIQAVRENAGLLSAISVLLPEKILGIELTDLVEDDSVRSEIATVVVRSLPWRTAETFLPSTQNVLREMLNTPDAYKAIDAMLAVSTQESEIDALWLNEVLGRLPFAKRDAFWCGYLKLGYKGNNIVRRIIETAKDIDLQKVDSSTAERWCVVLLWFSAAADRRVKDSAVRAAIAILRVHTTILPKVVAMFLSADDDEVRERSLLIAYGVLIHSRDKPVLKKLAEELLTAYATRPEDFQNAIIRDHIRCIAELAAHLDCLDKRFDPTLPSQRNLTTPRPEPPAKSEEEAWKDEKDYGVRLVVRSCMHDDFNHYSINCLNGWNRAMPKPAIGRWIAKRILDDFGYRGSQCTHYDFSVTQETGGGRGKPAWAERIGKKYQWIAMYQLASRLYDSADREKDSFERTTGRLPLILIDERKLDPTISRTKRADRTPSECWWVGGNVDLHSTKQLDCSTWVHQNDDLPSMQSLLAPKSHEGQSWMPLMCYPTWSEYREARPYGEPYRSTWIHLEAFLVQEAQFLAAMKAISRRNFFGNWMPRGAQWLHVFVGEYPWASVCNVETDDWLGFGHRVSGSKLEFVPVSNEINCEWEYDGSLPSSIHFHVPARAFFEAGPLWWDGVDGFSIANGKTVFRDPSSSEGGPATLLADRDDLLIRLKKLGCRLVWTLLGEKYILGEKAHFTPQVTYSQTASLNEDGTIVVGDRVFFEDHDKDQGLAS
ncbi:hypothetical protein [Nitrospira sp. BLG_1]|uniref:hypothetical protein n=1 Tax=Nitrospira sp. BLG_1 TaxID=3395883 RepID=UPI0039BCC2BE